MAFAVRIINKVVDVGVDLITGTVDIIADIVDFAVDEIIQPVVNGIGDVIEYAMDNPIEAIAKIGLTIASGGAYAWAIPLVDGAATLAKGGNIGDAIKASAISYVGGKVGGTVSKFVDPALASAGYGSTVSAAISGGTKSAATALVYGQDPLKAFATGGINAGVGALLGDIDTKLTNAVEGQLDEFGKPIVAGWENLQDGVKDSITASLAAELDGGSISANTLGNIVTKYTGVADTMNTFLTDNTGLSAGQAALMTSALTNAATTALAGNPEMSGEAFFAQINQYGMEQLKELADKPVDKTIDKITGAYGKTEVAATALNNAMTKTAEAASGFNGLREELNGRVQEQERLRGEYNTALDAYNANPSQETADTANIASAAFNNYATALDADYTNTYKPQMDAYMATYDEFNPQIAGLQDAYDAENQYLMSDIDNLGDELKPIFSGVNKIAATTLRPGINEDVYRELNGLEAGDDVYEHYLSNVGTARVFDVEQLNRQAEEAGENLYGEGYTVGYDEYGKVVYSLDTPDGKKKVDPYLEGAGGGRGGDPRDFNDGVWTMEQYRKDVADPVELGGRLTYDMAVIAGNADRQGQLISLDDFHKLKDAGYNISPHKSVFGTVDGTVSYNELKENSTLASDRKLIDLAANTEPTPVVYPWQRGKRDPETGYLLSGKITKADQNVLQTHFGYSDAEMEQYYPVGSRFNDAPTQDLIDAFDNAGYEPEDYQLRQDLEAAFFAVDKIYGDTENTEGGLTVPKEKLYQNLAGVSLQGVGEWATSIGELSRFLSFTDTEINDWTDVSRQTMMPGMLGSTSVALAATKIMGDWLQELGEGILTEDYKKGAAEFGQIFSKNWADEDKTAWEAFSDTFKAAPGYFGMELLVKEGAGEIPNTAIGGTVGKTVYSAAAYGGKKFSAWAATKVGVATDALLNTAEAAGGTYAGVYEDAYLTYVDANVDMYLAQGEPEGKAKVMAEKGAHEYADQLARESGMIAALTSVLLAPLGTAATKSILGDFLGDAASPSAINKIIKEGPGVFVKETVSEMGEEGITAAYSSSQLGKLDGRDVYKDAWLSALVGGTSAGGPTSFSIVHNGVSRVFKSTGDQQTDIAIISNPEFLEFMTTGANYDDAGNLKPEIVNTLETKLNEFDVDTTNKDTVVSIGNTLSNNEFTTKEEVKKFVALTNPTFEFTDEIAAGAYEELVGKKDDTQLESLVEQYIDPFFTTSEEAIAAAEVEGVTLTEEQITEIINDGNITEEEVVEEINEQFDDSHTSRAEAEQFFADLGYTATEEEITARVGATPDADQKTAIGEYVDPRQTTEAEARKFFEDQGYTPTDEEVAARVGQGDENFQATTKTDTDTYIDPRQVTDTEARQYFADLGYTPTDEQVAQFVAQVAETEQSNLISQYVDPRQVTRDELQNIANEEGLTLTDALAAAYVGQGEAENFASETLATAKTEYDPLATTQDEAAAFFESTGYTATTEEIAEFVASKTEEVQNSAIGAYVDPRQMTAAEAETFLSEIGYQPTQEEIDQFTGQVNDDSYQTTQQTVIGEYVDPRYVDAGEVRAAYEDLGLVDVSQEDVDRFVGQFDEETQLEAVSDYLPTATFNVIKQIVGSPSVEDNPNTDADESKDATGLYASLEDGKTRDEALQDAIDGVASDLGTTKTELLAEIDLTESQLSDEIDVVVGDVSDLTGDVSDLTGDVADVTEDVGELADVIGTAGVEDNPDTEVDETQDPTGLYATIKAYEDAGIARDDAIQKAVDDVSSALGTTKTDLLSAIGETESTLSGEIGDVETGLTEEIGDVRTDLGADIDVVANLVGKPAREVTATDVDFVIDLIAQENVSQELTTQYDVNADGIVDIADQTMLETALQGDTTALADTSIFNPATGLYAQQEQDTQATLDAITDMNTNINTQIDTNRKQANFDEFQRMLLGSEDLGGQQVRVTPGEKVQLDYMYDIGGDSIFATENQAGMFASPFGGNRIGSRPSVVANNPMGPMARASGFMQGGQVEDENDKLLRLLGDL